MHLVDGTLLVAHDLDQCKPGRTLEALYLAPLRERAKQNGGRVYRNGPTITLLIDIKSRGRNTYEAIHDLLEEYADIMTEFRGEKTTERAVTALISGNRPINTVMSQPVRYAAIDGQPPELERNPAQNLFPLVSASWGSLFEEPENGVMGSADLKKLDAIVEQAHAQGRRIRFWGGSRGGQTLAHALRTGSGPYQRRRPARASAVSAGADEGRETIAPPPLPPLLVEQ